MMDYGQGFQRALGTQQEIQAPGQLIFSSLQPELLPVKRVRYKYLGLFPHLGLPDDPLESQPPTREGVVYPAAALLQDSPEDEAAKAHRGGVDTCLNHRDLTQKLVVSVTCSAGVRPQVTRLDYSSPIPVVVGFECLNVNSIQVPNEISNSRRPAVFFQSTGRRERLQDAAGSGLLCERFLRRPPALREALPRKSGNARPVARGDAPRPAGPGRAVRNASAGAALSGFLRGGARGGPLQRAGPSRSGAGRSGAMLPAGCGLRLAAALAAALGEGAERRRELEQRAARSRALLQRWCSEEEEQLQPEAGSSSGHENKPSPEELEELELLNRALEKALKVRKSVLKAPLEAQGTAEEKSAGEGPALKNAEEQQVPLPLEDVSESTKVRTVRKKPASLKKHSPYKLRAPYRTDPDVKKLQRKAPARCVSQGPRTTGKSSSKGVACKQGRTPRTASSASDREVCVPAEPQKMPGLSKSGLNEQQSFSVGDSAEGKNSVAAGKRLFDAGKKSCGFLGESSKKEDLTTESALGRSTSPRTVTLQEKGCHLKLPLPYRKAYSRNSRVLICVNPAVKVLECFNRGFNSAAEVSADTLYLLKAGSPAGAWEWCHLCQTSADAAAARNRFIERIRTTFCSPLPAFSPAEIEEELKVLQDVPSLLSQYVEAEPADHPTLQRDYESLLTLEGLQTTVSQCLHKLQLLRAAVESQMRLCPDCAGDVGSCCPACVPPRGQTCDNAGLLAVPLLCYSSFQELKDLFALKLQVSMLHQEIALQKVMMAELLPVLGSRLCPEASAAQLYRAIYTQLCEGGKRFPVLVRDELAD
ncbi:LOW QUALITY PROTEIN: tubulin epsilon and delta complex protein 2 [Leptosomus discolor]